MDTGLLLKLLTERGHVKILCEDGEVRVNTFILGALSAIIKNILNSLQEEICSVFMFKELKQKDLLLLFQCLFQQVEVFSPTPKLVGLVQSFFSSEESGKKNTYEKAETEKNIDYEEILDDHDDIEQQKPVVIPIRDEQKMKVYKCHICEVEIIVPPRKRGEREWKKEKTETEHLSTVHGFEVKTCNICHIDCIDLEEHIERKHSKHKCHICGKIADSSIRLQIHILHHKTLAERQKEAKEERICPHCGKVFANFMLLRQHIKRSCGGIQYEEAQCEHCGKEFKNPFNLWNHVNRWHSGKVKSHYVCNTCGKILSSENSLNAHHEAVHGIRELTVKCELCGKLLVDKAALKGHMLTHAEKETCPMCGYKTQSHRMKIHHMRVHTKDEDKKFQCQDCGKGFIDKRSLNIHRINVHLKTKPYNCRYGCEISYNDSSNRNAHEKRTHGKLFMNVKEENLKEKIEMLGVDEKTFSNPIM